MNHPPVRYITSGGVAHGYPILWHKGADEEGSGDLVAVKSISMIWVDDPSQLPIVQLLKVGRFCISPVILCMCLSPDPSP